MKKTLLIVLMVLMVSVSAGATTYYVDSTCTNGLTTYNPTTHACDTGAATVYSSLVNAEAAITSGTHTVIIGTGAAAGVYAENLTINTAANITWQAETGVSVTIKSVNNSGIIIGSTSAMGTQTFSGITFTNAAAGYYVLQINENANVTFSSSTITGNGSSLYYGILADGDLLSGTDAPVSIAFTNSIITLTDGVSDNGAYGIMIRDVNGGSLSFSGTSYTVSTTDCRAAINIRDSVLSSLTIGSGCTFAWNYINPASPKYQYMHWTDATIPTITTITVSDSTFSSDTSPATPDVALLYIYANFTTCNISGNTFTSGDGTAMYVFPNASGAACNVFKNFIDGRAATTSGYGIGIGGDNPTTYAGNALTHVYKNIVWGEGRTNASSTTAYHGILLGGNASGSSAYCNFIDGTGYGFVVKGNTSGGNSQNVYSNIIRNTVGNDGILLKGSKNNFVYNNTLYNDASHAIDQGYISITTNTDVSPNITSTGNTLKNNIIYGDAQKYFIYLSAAANASGLSTGYNLYYDPEYTAASTSYFYNGTAAVTLAAWGTAFSDSTSTEGNPDFTDPASGEYLLRYDSPAINTGTDLGDAYDDALHPLSDFSDPDTIFTADQDLFGSGWEIGAYVYVPAGLH